MLYVTSFQRCVDDFLRLHDVLQFSDRCRLCYAVDDVVDSFDGCPVKGFRFP